MTFQGYSSSSGEDPDSLTRPNRSFPRESPRPTGTTGLDASPTLKSPRGKGGWAIWLILAGIGLAICLACAFFSAIILVFVFSQNQPIPEITMEQPLSDSQAEVGQPVLIRASASDRAGVTRVELWIDGILNTNFTSDRPRGQKTLLVEHSWVPTTGGIHDISLKAYNVSGQGSDPVRVTVGVEEAKVPTPTPTPQSAPTATPTPVMQTTATPTNTPVASPTPTVLDCTDDAAFDADVTVPDNTVFQPGASIDKTWRVRNSGTCPWDESYRLAFVSGNQMGAPDDQPIAATAPGGTTDVTVAMHAPSSYGAHTGVWRMVDASGEPFGQQLTVVIQVPSPHTPTPEFTPTAVPQEGPAISISADSEQVSGGGCTTIRASAEGVTAAWLDGDPIAGGSGEKEVCPCGETVYVLEADLPGGERVTKEVTVRTDDVCHQADLLIRDFVMVDREPDPDVGEEVTIRIRIKNQGGAVAKNFRTSWFPFGADGGNRQDFRLDSLDPGEDHDFLWEDIKFDEAGEYRSVVKVDYDDEVEEPDEENNVATLVITVSN